MTLHAHSVDFYLMRGMVIVIAVALGAGFGSGFLYLIGQQHLGWWLIFADLVFVCSLLAVSWVVYMVSILAAMWKEADC